MDMKAIMKQAQDMQSALAKKQDELAARTFEATSGGGMVTAIVNGKHEIIKLKIDPNIVSKEDVSMLEDLVTAAINEAFKKVGSAVQEEMAGMMGGLGSLKGLFG